MIGRRGALWYNAPREVNKMMTYEWARPEDEGALLDLINLVFALGGNHTDFRELIPRVYGKTGFAENSLLAKEDGAVRGVVSYASGNLVAGGRELKFGFIGNVATHPYARGQGVMQVLMQGVMDRLRDIGCDFAILGGQRQRYQRHGFELGSSKLTLRFTGRSLRHALAGDKPAYRFVPLEQAPARDVDSAWALHNEGALHVARSREDFPVTLRTWLGRTLLAYRDEALQGYLTLYSGRVGEFRVRDQKRLPHVLAALMAFDNQDSLELTLQTEALRLHPALFAAADSWEHAPVYMLRVFNWQRFLGVLLSWKAGFTALREGSRVLEIRGEDRLLLQVRDGLPRVSRTEDPADLTLGHQEAVRLLTLPYPEELFPGQPFLNWFPLPFDFPEADAF